MNVTGHDDATFADVLYVTEDILSDKSAGVATANATFDLTQLLGPRREALYKVIPMTVVYCVIFVTGVVGNVCTCLVIRRTKYMQTVTNYYLFNLAVADLLVLLLGLPQETYSFWSAYPWVFGETFCVLRTMAAETSTYASILTITAFTVERYVAICHLMLTQAGSSLRRAVKVIVLLWIVSAVCSVPMVVQFGLVYVTDDTGAPVPESVTCNIKPDRYLRHAFETSTFLFFLAPMTVITVLYALIGVAIRRSTLSRSSSDTSTQSGPRRAAEARTLQQARARRAVLKMLVAVVVAFFICWAPFHAQRLMVMYMSKSDDPSDIRNVIQHVLYYVSGVLYYVSSVINPILYNIMSLKFRQAFKNTILKLFRHKRSRPSGVYIFRFNRKHLGVDTNQTLIQRQLNGAATRNHRCFNAHVYVGARANNSSSASGGSCARILREESAHRIELEPVLAESKSRHSFQPCCTPTTVIGNARLYHSAA